MFGFRLSFLPSLSATAALLIGFGSSSSLLAQVHVEVGDAGELPTTAQILPAGAVTAIEGSLPVTGTAPSAVGDRDMYIFYTSGGTFSATVETPALGLIPDSQLFLFDSAGMGLFANDDFDPDGDGPLPVLASGPSRIVADLPAGQYFLAISVFDDEPISAGGLIFPTFFTLPINDFGIQVGPTGPGGSQPIIGWNENTLSQGFSYSINLTNAFGSPPDGNGNGNGNGTSVPDASSSLVLFSLGMLSLVAVRRRSRL